jgi:AraC-like DNA-binding protein
MTQSHLEPLRFSTSSLPDNEQFAAFRQVMSFAYEIDPIDGAPPPRFTANAAVWNFGPLKLGTEQFDPHVIRRTLPRAAIDGFDHYSAILVRRGLVERDISDSCASILAGRPNIHDASQPLAVRTRTPTLSITLSMPRDMLGRLLPDHVDLHGRALEGATGKLFSLHLQMLARTMPRLKQEEAPALARATLEILAACLSPSRDAVERARAPIEVALLAQARRFVEPQVHRRDLTPERIGQAIGVSRSTLYALFEPHGGVAAYVRGRRLARIHALLSDPHNRETIRDLALRHGFVSEAHFSRAFRQAYGYPPREVRASFGRLVPRTTRGMSDIAAAYTNWARLLYA